MNPRHVSVRMFKLFMLLTCLTLIVLTVFQTTDMASGREIDLLEEVPVINDSSQNKLHEGIANIGASLNVTTLNLARTSEAATLDPQSAEDIQSINYIENLFVNLINFDATAEEILPEAATAWEISADSMVYTFTVRTDIPWVKHDLNTGLTTQVVDGGSNPRFVTANDFVYSIKRACDPNVGGYYSGVIAPQIKGCSDVLNYSDPANIPPSLFDAIGVSAPSPDVLIIEMDYPAGHFMSMVPMWTLAATPQWAIDAYGEAWTDPENIVTSGRYVVHEWNSGANNTLWRNPLMPAAVQGSGNVEQIITTIVSDTSASYNLWLNGQADISPIPDIELANHLANYPGETDKIPELAVFYFGFRTTKPPFDDVHVRRAFSAAFARLTFVNTVRQGQGLPMKHFAPPGIFGAPPIDSVGVGYDVAYAQSELASAGYPGCAGFPTVTLLGYDGQSTLNWILYAQSQWIENLGCSANQIQYQQVPFSELLTATDVNTPDEDAPHMWTLGWGPDYPDENNWVGDVLWCQSSNRSKRSCNSLDGLIEQARAESDPNTRVSLYSQIEEGFFGASGEFPIAPLYLRTAYVARHAWIDREPALVGGEQWYNWTILPTIVSEIIPTSGGTLSSTLGATSYSFSAGTFTDSVVVTHTTQSLINVPSLGDYTGIGHYFDVIAVYESDGLPAQPAVGQSYAITITYTDTELGSAFESTLALYYWDGSQWVKESTSAVNTASNTVTAVPNHFSTWAVLGTSEKVYLPVVIR